ncbi:MAG: prepilin peptidase [Ignavibacteria bacterium]|nr:MAG: prepilin peptidase [Ignavibacteria bacterium]
MELLSGILTLVSYLQFGLSQRFLFYMPFMYAIIVIGMIDLRIQVIPNKILMFLLLFGIILNILLKAVSWNEILLGLFVSGLAMLLIKWAASWFLQKEGLGTGDVKLSALIGFFLGWKLFFMALFIASSIALLIVLFMKFVFGKNEDKWGRGVNTQQIPFAPFLGFGAIVSLFAGLPIWEWYLSVFWEPF